MAVGDVAPKRIVGGPKAGLGGIPTVDYDHNFLIAEGRDGIYIYDRTAEGDIEPLRKITGGPKSGVKSMASPLWIPGTSNFLVTARAFTAREKSPEEPLNWQRVEDAATFIAVFSVFDDGDAFDDDDAFDARERREFEAERREYVKELKRGFA